MAPLTDSRAGHVTVPSARTNWLYAESRLPSRLTHPTPLPAELLAVLIYAGCSRFATLYRKNLLRIHNLMNKTAYNSYLKSSHWQRCRRLKLEVNPVCERCSRGSGLQIHHRDYKCLGIEHLYIGTAKDCLETLCGRCHQQQHHRTSQGDPASVAPICRTAFSFRVFICIQEGLLLPDRPAVHGLSRINPFPITLGRLKKIARPSSRAPRPWRRTAAL